MQSVARLVVLLALLGAADAALAVPRFTSTPVTSATEDSAYQYNIATADTQGGQRQVSATTLPAWLTLTNVNLSNGSARISGTPTQAHVGTHPVSLQVRNLTTNSTAVQSFSIVVANVNDAPVITGQTPNPIPVEQGASLTIAFSHLVVTDVDNAYPTGFTLTVSNGTNYSRSGNTITPAPTFVGTLAVPVRVNDGAANSNSFNLAVTVASRATRADLSLSVAAVPAPALVSAPIEWRFTIGNTGPDVSAAISLTAEFAGNPFGFTDLQSCTVTPVADRQRLACSVASIAPGATSTVVLRGAAAQGGDLYVAAGVAGAPTGPADPSPANNTAATTLHVAEVVSATPAQQLPSAESSGVAAGDVDGDGFADVMLAKASGGADLYFNVVDRDNPARRKLTDLPLAVGGASPISSLLLVDLDRDADLDLVATNRSGGANTVYSNGGTAVFTPVATLGAGTSHGAASADLDGDGLTDLVFANNGPNTVHLNRGGGVFSLAAQLDNDDSREVLALDLDLDGLADLVFANANGPSRFYRNLGAGAFASGVVVDAFGAHTVAAADFNRDGRTDLVLGARGNVTEPPSSRVYQNNPGVAGSPLFVLLTKLGAAQAARVLTTDLDADGVTDIVTLTTTGTHQVYRGNGAGGFSLHPVQFSWGAAAGAAAARISVDTSIDLAIGGAAGSAVLFNDGRGGLGLGDTTAPVIRLIGESPVTVTISEPYQDRGATATDDVDGDLTARIATANPVNTNIVGTYTVTYDVMDSSGNAAARATRTVQVAAREGTGGGGGGAIPPLEALLLALLAACRRKPDRP
jgi:hypothetical protein